MSVTSRPFGKSVLTPLAWLNVVFHVIALSFAALGMRPGTPLVGLSERLAYLASFPLGWSLGWGAWMLCALALIAFLAVLAHQLHERADLARLALMIAIAGGAFDLFCDTIYITLFPLLASWQPPPEALFLTLERLTAAGSLVIANGLYSIAILLFTLTLRRRQGMGSFPIVVGYLVFGFGMLLAAAGFTGVPWHAEWATGPTIGLFCVWVIAVARSLNSVRGHP
jgi:hypothetical protein